MSDDNKRWAKFLLVLFLTAVTGIMIFESRARKNHVLTRVAADGSKVTKIVSPTPPVGPRDEGAPQ